METKTTIAEFAYELYKQDWVEEHVSKEMKLDALRYYFLYVQECEEDDVEAYSFETWIDEVGYDSGSLYVCFEEFWCEEYQNEEYMCELLKMDDLINLYYEDIKKS